MRRRTLILGTGTAAVTALAGCLGNSQAGSDDNPDSDTRTIFVSESSEVEADPDLAVIRASVEVTGDDAEFVRDELADRGDALYDALVEYGLDEEDVTTSDFTIRDRIDYRRAEADGVDPRSEDDLDEYRYYEGSHSLRIEVHEVENTGEVIDVTVDAGADEIGRIEFTLSDETRDELRQEALENALEAARSEADFVAAEVDATVVEAKTVDTSGGDVSPVWADYEMEEAMDADVDEPSTEIHPDDVTVRATVDVVYEME